MTSTSYKGIESFKCMDTHNSYMSSKWTEEELSTLNEKYEYLPNDKLSDEIDRTTSAIKTKASNLDIYKDHKLKTRWIIRNSELSAPECNQYKSGYVVGLTDGEGSFNYRWDDRGNLNFRYALELVSGDSETVYDLKDFFGVGSVYDGQAQKEARSDTKTYTVYSTEEISNVIIPFFVDNKPQANLKREQFIEFCETFIDYYELNGERLKWVDRV